MLSYAIELFEYLRYENMSSTLVLSAAYREDHV